MIAQSVSIDNIVAKSDVTHEIASGVTEEMGIVDLLMQMN